MTKPKQLDDKTKAARELRRCGTTPTQIDAFELAVLQEVMSRSSIGGNASTYVLERIRELNEKDSE